MKKVPICIFENQEQLDASLKEWKKRLFLSDWIIEARMAEPHEMNDVQKAGECKLQHAEHCALIQIIKPECWPRGAIARYCAERTLVHELLHCKMNWIEKDMPTIQEFHYDACEHALLEQIAKSLIMAKYDIGLRWFANK